MQHSWACTTPKRSQLKSAGYATNAKIRSCASTALARAAKIGDSTSSSDACALLDQKAIVAALEGRWTGKLQTTPKWNLRAWRGGLQVVIARIRSYRTASPCCRRIHACSTKHHGWTTAIADRAGIVARQYGVLCTRTGREHDIRRKRDNCASYNYARRDIDDGHLEYRLPRPGATPIQTRVNGCGRPDLALLSGAS
jgi:hypothetical protein